MKSSMFFTVITIAILATATLQTSIALEVSDVCDSILVTAPALAAGCLFGSFACTGAWIAAKMYKANQAEKLALFCWTIVLSVGLVSIGAAMGQAQVYDKACPALNSNTNFNTLGLVSIVLLVLSVATPHGWKPEKKEGDDYGTLTRSDTTDAIYNVGDVQSKKPLIFI